MNKFSFVLIFLAVPLCAQVVPGGRPTIVASGQATLSVAPDQAKIDLTVTAQGATAQAATSKDAGEVSAVLTAITKLLGAGADIKTINYFVGPNYSNGPNQTIVGYTASSTLEVTLSNLTLAGTVIDTAVGAGATSVGGVQFSLQNSDPAHQQALKAATIQAMAHATAMATAVSHTVGPIVLLSESGFTPTPLYAGVAGAPVASTTIVPGQIQVQATVTLQAELD